MHTLTLEFASTKELLDFASKHLNPNTAVITGAIHDEVQVHLPSDETIAVAAKDAAPKPKKATKVKVEAAATDLSTEDKPEPKKAEPAAEGKVLDYKTDVRPIALKLIKHPDGDGQARMAKIFDDFGVTNATELTAEQLPAYLAAVQAELGE